jgi:hypothetical protein
VSAEGRVDLAVPLPAGTPVEVVVLAPEDDPFENLVQATASSIEFWDNPEDDEDWNNA